MLLRIFLWGSVGVLASACSASHGALPGTSSFARAVQAPASSSTIAVAITVKVPAAALGAQSVVVKATGGAAVTQNLSPTASGCTAASGPNPLTCTFNVDARVGTDVFTFATFSGANGGGSKIASAKLQKAAGTGTVLSTTLSGTAASVTLALPSTAPRQCDPSATLPLYVMAKTAATDFIVGAYGVTVHLSDGDASGDTSLSAASVTSTSQSVTLNYDGHVLQSATITPSAAGIPNSKLHAATLRPAQMMYVTDFNNGINEFPIEANGNIVPVRHFALGATTEDDWLTPDCKLYVTINGADSVTIIPLQGGGFSTISGSNTGLLFPMAVGVDSTGKIYVSTQQDSSTGKPGIEIYPPGSTGNATPSAFLGGSNTKMQAPNGLTFDAADTLYVADIDSYVGHPAIEVFSPGSTGNVAPSQIIYGSTVTAFGVALDPSGNIYVSNGNLSTAPGTIDEFPSGTNGSPPPSNSIDVSYPHGPGGIALDYKGNIHVNVLDSNTVLSYPANASGSTPPSTVLTGNNTGFVNAEDLAL
ncbi:MAG TPA: hypothetical protein VGZ02_11120 [Candidatus Baltobacteraceae bacterium]|nr:hypothetical protein [Candidatus Baltobacteraceae bacterium]